MSDQRPTGKNVYGFKQKPEHARTNPPPYQTYEQQWVESYKNDPIKIRTPDNFLYSPNVPLPGKLNLRQRIQFRDYALSDFEDKTPEHLALDERIRPEEWFYDPPPRPPTQITPGGNEFDTPANLQDVPLNRWGQPDYMAASGWDYKNPPVNENGVPINHEGMELPEGALSFKPDGSPYFESWWEGYLWKAFGSKPSDYTSEQEDEIVYNWKPSQSMWQDMSDAWDGEMSWLEAATNTWRRVSTPVQRAWRSVATEDDEFTAIGKAGRFIGATMWQAIEGIGAISEGVERGLGASALTWKDLAGDKALDLGDLNIRTANFNWVYEMTVAPLWNMFQAFSQGNVTRDSLRDRMAENKEAARIAYSMFQDEALKEEFVRRMKAGENPDLLALELQNPWTEMWGLAILDPLNYVGGSFFKTKRLTNLSDDAAGAVARAAGRMPEIMGLEELTKGQKFTDVLKANVANKWRTLSDNARLEKLGQLVDEQINISKNVGKEIAEQARKTNLLTLTADGKRYVVSQNMAEATMFLFQKYGKDVDDPFAMMKVLAELHSDDAGKVRNAMTAVMNSDSPDVLLSDRFQRLGKMLHESIFDPTSKTVDAERFISKLEAARAEGNIEKVMEEIYRVYGDTIDVWYPSLPERGAAIRTLREGFEKAGVAEDLRDFDKVSDWGQALVDAQVVKDIDEARNLARAAALGPVKGMTEFAARFDKFTKTNLYNHINAFYASVYMGLTPGYAVRNWISNSFHILIDQGPAAWGKGTLYDSKKWIDHTSTWLGGMIPKNMTQGIGKSVFAEGAEMAMNWKKPFRWALDLAQKFEVQGSHRVVGKVVDDVMSKVLTDGAALPAVDILRAVDVSPTAAAHLQDLIVRNFGDVDAAMVQFLENFDQGMATIFKRRGVQWIQPEDREAFQGLRSIYPDLGDEFRAAQDAASLPEALERIEEIRRRLREIASTVNDEVPPIPTHGNPEVFRAMDEIGEAVADANKITHNARYLATSQASDQFAETMRLIQDHIVNSPDWDYALFRQVMLDEGVDLTHLTSIKAETTAISTALRERVHDISNALRGKQNKTLGGLGLTDAPGERPYTKVWEAVRVFDEELPQGWGKQEILDYMWNVAWPEKTNALWRQNLSHESDMFNSVFRVLQGKINGRGPEVLDQQHIATAIEQLIQKQSLAWQLSESVYMPANKANIPLRNMMYVHMQDGSFPNAARVLANRYGIATVSDSGAKLDKVVVNTLNKYGPMMKPESLFSDYQLALHNFLKDILGENIVWDEIPDDAINALREMAISNTPAGEYFRQIRMLAADIAEGGSGMHESLDHVWDVEWKLYVDNVRNALKESKLLPDDEIDTWIDTIMRKRVGRAEAVDAIETNIKTSIGSEMREVINANKTLSGWTKIKSLGEIDSAEKVRKMHDILEFRAQQGTGQGNDFVKWLSSSRSYDELRLENAVEQSIDEIRRIPMPSNADSTVTPGRNIYEQLDEYEALLDRLGDGLTEVWDDTEQVFVDQNIKNALNNYASEARGRIDQARLMAIEIANAAREFTLLDYNKKGGMDLLAGYLFPYHYWYSRTYANWMKRVAMNPSVIAAYDKYRDALGNVNAGAPDWWRYNVRIDNLLGIDLKNPLFFNLEATLNPLQGMLGVDFNDPEKRVDLWTRTLDDIAKIGPSVWTPYQIATAYSLYLRGENEAASRWAGRFVPQTNLVRSVGGLFGKDIEIDPFVHMFGGGYDAYERGRIGRALGTLAETGRYSPEAVIDAAREQEGEIWDAAVEIALNQRAGGQIASYFLGVGFKARTPQDMQIDAFYRDYRRMWAMSGNMSPDALRSEMDGLRERYPFMDTLLVSRKSGLEQDRGIAYNVLGRIPPGMTNDVAEMVGIDGMLLNKFYEDKGHIEEWAETDRNRFMAAIIDIGAVFAMPEGATRREWSEVRSRYRQMREQTENLYGKEIWDYVDMFYSASQLEDEQARALRNAIIAAHPEVQGALDLRESTIMNDPLLYDYYGGLDFATKYHTGLVYDELYSKFPDISEKWDTYFTLKAEDERKARAYFSNTPELKQYLELKEQRMEEVEEYLDKMGDYLQAHGQDTLRLRYDVPKQPGLFQEGLMNEFQQGPTWADYEQVIGQDASELMTDYFLSGEDMPPALLNHLSSIAGVMGVSVGELVNQLYQAYMLE